MKLNATLVLLFLLSCPFAAFAKIPKQVEADFAVKNGVVIMQIGEDYVVDLDAQDSLNVGDILTLVTPGKKIYHPVTKELLGTEEKPTGHLQVTRIHSGYSYARLLASANPPENGAQVRRFEQVPALFVDNKGDEGILARQLQMDLPQFKWLSSDSVELPLLTFVLKADTLVVKTSEGNLLHSYTVTDNMQLATTSAPVRQPFISSAQKPEPKLLQKVANSLLETLSLKSDDPFSVENVGIIRNSSAGRKGVWMGPNLAGNPVGIAVADLDNDGLQETAVALDNKLLIAQITQGQYTAKAEISVPAGLKLLSLDAADLDNNGNAELYVTAASGDQLASFVVQYTDGAYKIIIDNVKWFLRVVHMTGEGQRLVAQKKSHNDWSFRGEPFLVRMEGDRLLEGAVLALPVTANLYNFLSFADKEDRAFLAYLTADDYLKVLSADGSELWESSEYYGGSETCLVNREEHRGDMTAPFCISSRLIKGSDNEILVAQNDGQRIMQRYKVFKESRLVSLSWNGYSLVENWRTASQKGYLGDYALADADNDGKGELAMAVKFKHKGPIDDARSTVVTYEME